MASLRRPSSFFPGHKNESVRNRLPKIGDTSRRRQPSNSKVEQKMKNRRMSRYAGPEQFNVSSNDDANYLGSDPYQFTLEVAQPIMEEGEYTESPTKLRPTVPIGGVFPGTSPGRRQRELDIDEEDEEVENAGDEQIRQRGPAEAEWDFSELLNDKVDIASYLHRTLTGADEDEKKRFIAALHRRLDDNSKDLRRTVFKNYATFVNMTKEISTLESDMIELKELLTEWKTVPQLMGMDDTLAPSLDKDGNVQRSRTRRRSPLDLQQMYRQQITTLWSTVEGSQKYLPLAAGRHLVFETHAFLELNSATYKAKQNVSLFLLNDLLLVAGRRRLKTNTGTASERDGERGRMVAERCWVLGDLVVVDLKDTGDLTNALKVKRGKEVCVYRANKPEDKKLLLNAFRQVSNELAERRRKESEAEQERRRTMWHGDAGANARMTRMSMFMSMDQQRPISTIGTSLTETKDLLWIDDFGDDLTMTIAKQDWAKSVVLVERGQDLLRTVAGNADATEMLQFRLDSLRPTVIQRIANELSSPEIRKKSAKELIGLLVRLDRAELARDTFLKARHDLTVRLVRTIKHEGDISLYISELAVVCFTIIRHTSDWYLNAFELMSKDGPKTKDNHMASGFVIWAKAQIEYFADIFRRQVYAPTIDEKTVQECLQVTATANRKLLRDVGLDFTFLLNSLTQRYAGGSEPASDSPQVSGFSLAIPSPYNPAPARESPQISGFSVDIPSPYNPAPVRESPQVSEFSVDIPSPYNPAAARESPKVSGSDANIPSPFNAASVRESPQIEGFDVEIPSPYVPSRTDMAKENHPSPPMPRPPRSPEASKHNYPSDLSRGTTAPLSISRRPKDSALPPSSMRDRDNSNTFRKVSVASSIASFESGGSSSPVPRPPPRSERRSRPPTALE